MEKLKVCGIKVVSAFSDYSKSFIRAVKEVYPDAGFQADHFHTVKNIWKNSKKCLSEYRNELKSEAEKKEDKDMSEIASVLWKLRRILLKKPSDLTDEEKEKIAVIEKRDDKGFISTFRNIIRQIVNISDFSNTEIQAEIKLKHLSKQTDEINNDHFKKIPGFFTDHWNEAMQYLRKRGVCKIQTFFRL